MEEAYKEALIILRRQAETNPAAYLPKVAETLNDLGLCYLDTQKFGDAERIFREAMAIGHQICHTNPDERNENNDILAQTLISLSQTLIESRGANPDSCDLMLEAQKNAINEDLKKEAREFLDENCK